MTRRPGLCLAALLLLAAAGCKSHNCDLVEAELRSKDRDLHVLRDEICKIQSYNEALRREVGALRHGPGPFAHPAEAAGHTFGLQTISLGRGTGGEDADGCFGDEGLQVVVEPRDCDGHVVKAPGTLVIKALEVNQEGLKKPLDAWLVPPDQLRRFWRSGLLSTGYFVILPWRRWPSVEKVRIVAQLTLPDGRAFEADRDVTVKLTPMSFRKPPPAPAAPEHMPPADEPLPPPRPLPQPPPAEPVPPPVHTTAKARGVHVLPPVPRR
jgi:hypothetical protein